MLRLQLMKTLTILNHKAQYSPALLAGNTLYDIRAVNYIVTVGIAKLSATVETDEPAMLGKNWQYKKLLNDKYTFGCRAKTLSNKMFGVQ